MNKILLIILFLVAAYCAADVCPHDKEVECITDVNHGTFRFYFSFRLMW